MGIAFVFWFFTKLSDDYKTQFSLSLRCLLPEDKILLYPAPPFVEVDVKGKGWDLWALQWRKLPVLEIDPIGDGALSAADGDPTLFLEGRISALFPNVTILNVRPSKLSLALEEAASKHVPLVLQGELQLAERHILRDSIRLQPATVRVMGPVSLLRDIEVWHTEPLNLSGVRENFSLKIPLQRHANANVVALPDEVLCSGNVEMMTEKKLEIPLEIRNAEAWTQRLSILPKKIELACLVGLSRYDRLSPDDFVAYVDFQNGNLPPGQEGLRVRLEKSPDFVRQVHFYPRSVDFILRSE